MSNLTWHGALQGAVLFGRTPTGEPLHLVIEPHRPDRLAAWSYGPELVDALGGCSRQSCLWRAELSAEIVEEALFDGAARLADGDSGLIATHEGGQRYTIRVLLSEAAVGLALRHGPEPLRDLCEIVGVGSAWLTVQRAERLAWPPIHAQPASALYPENAALVRVLARQVDELWERFDWTVQSGIVERACKDVTLDCVARCANGRTQ